jgi:hypothetical protein
LVAVTVGVGVKEGVLTAVSGRMAEDVVLGVRVWEPV